MIMIYEDSVNNIDNRPINCMADNRKSMIQHLSIKMLQEFDMQSVVDPEMSFWGHTGWGFTAILYHL